MNLGPGVLQYHAVHQSFTDTLVIIPPYGSMGGYLVYCVFCLFVVLFVCFFVQLQISQRRKNIGAWNFARVLAYYPDRSSPLLMNFGSRGVTGVAALLPGWAANCQYLAEANDPCGSWWRGSVGIWNWMPGVGGQLELGAAALLKAVWWDLHLASLLMQLFLSSLFCVLPKGSVALSS